MTKIVLPKIYEIKENTPEKYHKYEGLPKLSYSQYTSWKDEGYRIDYIKQYFFGLTVESPFQIFADFGSNCGEYLEYKGQGLVIDRSKHPLLSDSDVEVLDSIDLSGENTYEEEIVYPVKDSKGNIIFVIQGFIDKSKKLKDGITICDFKTGATKKQEFYGSEEYGQTTLYAHTLSEEGNEIKRSYVQLLCRKGNNRPGHPIRLEGGIIEVETPYTKTRAKKVIKDMTKVAKEIGEYYKVILKVRNK